jgi:hypothetical protein
VIHNPDPWESDPDVYHQLFSQFGDVVMVTLATDNGTARKGWW